MNNYDVVIIGAGIVGLASALRLVTKNPSLKIIVLEKEDEIAKHQTGHNSGVIHSGIYYQPGSAKARNCVNGYNQLITFCQQESIPYEICGKIIVATSDDQLATLDELFNRGIANGLAGIEKISPAEIKEYEPHAEGVRGIYVPQTGIIDFVFLAKRYADIIQENGVEVRLGCGVSNIRRQGNVTEVITGGQTCLAKVLVTCAGLQADRSARKTQPNLPLRIIPFRGEYYIVKREKRGPVNSLIYPVPDPALPFLGVHFTRMIDGEVEAGPNAVLAFKREAYGKAAFSLNDTKETLSWPGFYRIIGKYWKTGLGEVYRSLSKKAFVEELRKLIPEISDADLQPGGAGVRAQACDRRGSLLDDFCTLNDRGIIHVCNAPSPAATSSLAVGEHISETALNILGY